MWKDFLANYPSSAIDWAFENWQRNGHFFPKPAQILELIRAYHIDHRENAQARYEHHGEGYGEGDVLALWKIFQERFPHPLSRRLTYEQRQDLVDEMERRRERA